jgi:hypothetical protein
MRAQTFWSTLIAAAFFAPAPLAAQDFNKNYHLGAGGAIRIMNISGDVVVSGYGGDSVVVTATKTGRNRDRVEIVDNSGPDSVELKVRYPEREGGDASVAFDVQVPRGIRYNFEKLYSISGDVRIHGVTGQVRAKTVSGTVVVLDVVGLVSADSVSGDVNVEIRRLDESGDMKFASVSGNVTVKAPANLDGSVEMHTVSGGLRVDFPIEVTEPRYGPGRSARGRLGNGSRNLGINSVSGRVSLLKF